MRTYSFEYIDGHNRPSSSLQATDDDDFAAKLRIFLGNSRELVGGTVRFQESGHVADPSGVKVAHTKRVGIAA